MNKLLKVTATIALLTTSACSGLAGSSNLSSSAHGAFQLTADKEGMRAFSDTITGIITTGKSSPDIATSHDALRQQQELETTKREAYKALPSSNPFAKFLNNGGK